MEGDSVVTFADPRGAGSNRTAEGSPIRGPKRPRVTKACRACRKRKTSCSGDDPCKRCNEEGIECDYNVVDGRKMKKRRDVQSSERIRSAPNNQSKPANHVGVVTTHEAQEASTTGNVSRTSIEPEVFDDQHTGAVSGLAFLHEAVQRIEYGHQPAKTRTERLNQASKSIFTSGDMPFIVEDLANLEFPSIARSESLLSRYFDFATPSYRFLHRPSVEDWAKEVLSNSNKTSETQKAIVFLLWAQALEYRAEGGEINNLSHLYYAKARSLIDNEPGPPKLESVQVRLASCLYLLSTSRINECWYSFGITTFIITALGLHRKTVPSPSISLIESECRKRVFWSAYTLDRYLSVMKGRPRVFRDEDVDQDYPANVSDSDMIFTDVAMIQHLPQHGLMETTVNHAKLASIMGRATDMLYPLRPPKETDLLQRAELMVEELDAWEADLPQFLKPSKKTLTGQRIFERQNSVIKLAHAHVRIMITRLFIVGNFAALGQHQLQASSVAQKHIDSCLDATYTIIDTVEAFLLSNTLISGFWFTQYIALCAISTLYIYVIHHHLDPATLIFENGKNYFTVAESCQKYISNKALPSSPNRRYLVLLSQLRKKARRPFSRPSEESRDLVSRPENENTTNTLSPGGTQHHNANQFENVAPSMPLIDPQAQDFGFDNFDIGTLTSSESIPEFEALPLSWGYLDQLAFPETYNYLDLSDSQY